MAQLRIGDTAPNFDAQTTEGNINFYDWQGDSWVVLFSHPADFTPVCTTELGRTASLGDEFKKRHVKPIALSVDSVEDHKAWAGDISETQGCEVNFPIIADADKKVSEAYDMIHPNASTTHTVRSVFIIDPQLDFLPSLKRGDSFCKTVKPHRKNVPTGIDISIVPCATRSTSPSSYSQTCSTFRTVGGYFTATRTSLGSVSL